MTMTKFGLSEHRLARIGEIHVQAQNCENQNEFLYLVSAVLYVFCEVSSKFYMDDSCPVYSIYRNLGPGVSCSQCTYTTACMYRNMSDVLESGVLVVYLPLLLWNTLSSLAKGYGGSKFSLNTQFYRGLGSSPVRFPTA